MQKFIIKAAAVIAVALFCGCSVGAAKKDDTFYQKGIGLVQKMDSMAEDESYISFFTASEEINTIISEMGKGDYSSPKNVYKISLTPSELDQLIHLEAAAENKISDTLAEELRNRFFSSLPLQINALNGAQTLAAASIITSQTNFIYKNTAKHTIYFYIYDSGCCAAVSFTPGEESIVSATGYFIINEALNNVSSAEEMAAWLKENSGIINCEIEGVKQ